MDKPGGKVQNNVRMLRLSPIASLFEASGGNEENTFRGMETLPKPQQAGEKRVPVEMKRIPFEVWRL